MVFSAKEFLKDVKSSPNFSASEFLKDVEQPEVSRETQTTKPKSVIEAITKSPGIMTGWQDPSALKRGFVEGKATTMARGFNVELANILQNLNKYSPNTALENVMLKAGVLQGPSAAEGANKLLEEYKRGQQVPTEYEKKSPVLGDVFRKTGAFLPETIASIAVPEARIAASIEALASRFGTKLAPQVLSRATQALRTIMGTTGAGTLKGLSAEEIAENAVNFAATEMGLGTAFGAISRVPGNIKRKMRDLFPSKGLKEGVKEELSSALSKQTGKGEATTLDEIISQRGKFDIQTPFEQTPEDIVSSIGKKIIKNERIGDIEFLEGPCNFYTARKLDYR